MTARKETITGGARRSNGTLRAQVMAMKPGQTLTVEDSYEAEKLQAGARHYGVKLKKSGNLLTRV